VNKDGSPLLLKVAVGIGSFVELVSSTNSGHDLLMMVNPPVEVSQPTTRRVS